MAVPSISGRFTACTPSTRERRVLWSEVRGQRKNGMAAKVMRPIRSSRRLRMKSPRTVRATSMRPLGLKSFATMSPNIQDEHDGHAFGGHRGLRGAESGAGEARNMPA